MKKLIKILLSLLISFSVVISVSNNVVMAEYQRDENAEYSATTFYFTFNFKRENYSNTAHETEAEKDSTQKAINNKYFRLAVQAALDKYEYTEGTLTRNVINLYKFDTLTTGEVYGDLVKDKYVEYLSEFVNSSVDLSDGSNGLYNPDLVKAYIAKAKTEGVEFPVVLDVVGLTSRARGVEKLKSMIETASDGNILINLTLFDSIGDYYATFYFADRLEDLNCDMVIGSGWAPDRYRPDEMISGVIEQLVFKGSDADYTALKKNLGIDVLEGMLEEAQKYSYGDELLEKSALAEAYALSNCYVIPYSTTKLVDAQYGIEYPFMVLHQGEMRTVQLFGNVDNSKPISWEILPDSIDPSNPELTVDASKIATIDENGNITAISEGSVTVEVTYYLTDRDNTVTTTAIVAVVPWDMARSDGDYSKVYALEFYLLQDDIFELYMQLYDTSEAYRSIPAYIFYKFVTEGIPKGIRGNKEFIVENYKKDNPELATIYSDNISAYYARYVDGYSDANKFKGTLAENVVTVKGAQDEEVKNVVLNGTVLGPNEYSVVYDNEKTEIFILDTTVKSHGGEIDRVVVELTTGVAIVEKGSSEEPEIEVEGRTRVYGTNRFGTSFAIAETILMNSGKEKLDCVILANGDNFADALAGSYLAAVKNAPIIITRAAKVAEVNDYIKSVLADKGTIYVLGGPAAVPESSLKGLSGYTIKRLHGSNRYGTNLEILKEAGVEGDTILIATGTNYADSLSASATGLPMLLVKGADKLIDEQKAFLKENKGKKLVVLGGEGAVSKSIENELSKYGTVERVKGDNRFETSVKIAEYFFDDATTVVLAYGSDFPDGLCGGPLANQIGAPLILTRNDKTDIARPYTKARNITEGYALGGTSVLPDATIRKLFGAGSDGEIKEITG